MLILTGVDALVDQRKNFNYIGLMPGKLATGNNCMCEHSYCLSKGEGGCLRILLAKP